MTTLFIIDQSLTNTGGHHFDYTRLLAESANDRGIQTVIGTNQKLQSGAEKELRLLGSVNRIFRHSTYSRLSQLAGLRELTGNDIRPAVGTRWSQKGRVHGFLERMGRRRLFRQRSRLIRNFAQDCEALFRQYPLREGDQVFFTTISEIEFMGLAAFLSNSPETINVTWHVQFHFSMFEGRPDEFHAQSRIEHLLENAFQAALARVPYHNINAYTTSEELADQYNRMKLIFFQPLPYPINPRLCSPETFSFNVGGRNSHLPDSAEPSWEKEPLSVAVAGGVRREKGQKDRVHRLINDIWQTQLNAGRIRLNIQTGNPGLFSSKRVIGKLPVDQAEFSRAVRLQPHPLPAQDYIRFIQDADVGLFCYDSRRYYSRRAGILGEFLACGKPVIVPAGSWLARQIAEPCDRHIRDVLAHADRIQQINATELRQESTRITGPNDKPQKFNAPLAGGIICFDKSRNPFQCRIQAKDLEHPNTRDIVVGFRWHWPRKTGTFVRVELKCLDAEGNCMHRDAQIVTRLPEVERSLVYLRACSNFSHASLTFTNAFLESSINIADVQVNLMQFDADDRPARGSVGIAVADHDMLVQAIDEMIVDYQHYRQTAIQFSLDWATRHDPAETLETLVPNTNQIRCAA